jgi:hypothetical protein
MLLWHYPRRDCAHMAEAALARVLDEADDPGQLRCCLFDGAMAYVADMRAKNSFQFMSLAAFIEDGRWRPEFLPGNMAMAA